MPAPVAKPRTLYDKIWDDHVMYASCDPLLRHEQRADLSPPFSDVNDDGLALIYIDRYAHFISIQCICTQGLS